VKPPRLATALSFAVLAALTAGCHDIRLEAKTAGGDIGLFDDLFGVTALDDKQVVAGGYYGTIYRSQDGGQTWKKSPTGTLRSIYDVSIAPSGQGWAVGQSGLVLRTTDGGNTWTPQPNAKEAEGSHLFAVYALDGNTAWAVGEWGSRISTDDGGSTWKDDSLTIDEQHPQFVWLAPVDQDRVRKGEKVYEDVSLNDVSCLPAPSRYCWIAGEFGYIFTSQNGGQLWERASITGDVAPESVPLPYNVTDISEADIARLKAFADRIHDETHLNVEIEPMANAQEIATFGKADDPTPLFEILDARSTAVRSVIEEAGILSDRIRMRGAPPWDYEDFLDSDPDFLKRYLAARQGDAPGIQVRVAQNPYLFSVRFVDEQNGYISALGGLILHSTDGGRTWGYKRTARRQALFSIASAKSGRTLAVGEKGFIQVSDDQGQTWVTPGAGFPPIFTFMRDITFSPDRSVGYIVGQSGTVLRSADDGATWTRVLPRTAETAAK